MKINSQHCIGTYLARQNCDGTEKNGEKKVGGIIHELEKGKDVDWVLERVDGLKRWKTQPRLLTRHFEWLNNR